MRPAILATWPLPRLRRSSLLAASLGESASDSAGACQDARLAAALLPEVGVLSDEPASAEVLGGGGCVAVEFPAHRLRFVREFRDVVLALRPPPLLADPLGTPWGCHGREGNGAGLAVALGLDFGAPRAG